MAPSKKYDGSQPVLHVVQPGESLSRIARHYRLPGWHPIWLYNSKVLGVYLGEDPDIIRPGDQLFIPRSPQGYDRLIKRLQALKVEMIGAGDQERYRLEGQRWAYKAQAEIFDFAGEALTTLATFGLKAASAARAATVAEATQGRAKAAAKYLADRRATELAEWVDGAFKEKATGAIAKKVDDLHSRHTGRDSSVGENTHRAVGTGKKVVEAIRGFSLTGGKALLDAAEIGLDFTSPTKLANIILKLSVGETVDDAHTAADKQIQATVKQAVGLLDERIARIAAERHTVYPPGGSQVGKYIEFPPLHINVPVPARL